MLPASVAAMNDCASSAPCGFPDASARRLEAWQTSSPAGGRIVPRGEPARHARVPRLTAGEASWPSRRRAAGAAAAGADGGSASRPRAYRETRSVGMLVLDDRGRAPRSSPGRLQARLEAARGLPARAAAVAAARHGAPLSGAAAAAGPLPGRGRLFRPTPLLICHDCVPVGQGGAVRRTEIGWLGG